jgi:hypothetical protein
MGSGGTEILDDGRGEPRAAARLPGRRRPDRLSGPWLPRLRRHPVVTGALVVALVAGAGALAAHQLRAAALPALVVTPASDDGAPWQDGPDGRPDGPARLLVTASVRRAASGSGGPGDGGAGGELTVVGLAGPGVVRNAGTAVVVPVGGAPVEVPLRADLDCRRVPEVVAADAFRLRVQVRDGNRTRSGLVSAGPEGRRWAGIVQSACAGWIARQDLTVTAVSARPDPVVPRLAITLTVTDAGGRDAVLTGLPAGGSARFTGPLPLRIPANGTATVDLTVDLNLCDAAMAGAPGTPDDRPMLSSLIDLVGQAGPAPASDLSTAQVAPGAAGFAEVPTGLVLSTPSARTLTGALAQACGGALAPLVLLIPVGGVHYDAGTRVLGVDVLVDTPPGRVRAASLAPLPSESYGSFVHSPLWTATPEQQPDASGQLRFTLPFRAADAGPCPTFGGMLPSLVATLKLPTATVERTVRYSLFADLAEDFSAIHELCDPAQSGATSGATG